MAYTLNWNSKDIVYWTYSGDVTGDEIVESTKTIYGDPRFDHIKFKIVDFLDTTSISMTKRHLDMVSSFHRAAAISNPHIKNAILVNQNSDNAKTLARVYIENLKNSPWELKIIHSREALNDWMESHKHPKT